jgi:hypothetical protein
MYCHPVWPRPLPPMLTCRHLCAAMLRAWRRFHGSGGLRGSLADTPVPDQQSAGQDQQQAGAPLESVSWTANPTYGSAGPEYGSKARATAATEGGAQDASGGADVAADPFKSEGWCHEGYGPVAPTVSVTFCVEYLEMRKPGAQPMQLLNEIQGGHQVHDEFMAPAADANESCADARRLLCWHACHAKLLAVALPGCSTCRPA